jgi:YggT family protein
MSTNQQPVTPTDPSAVEPSVGRRMLTMMDPRFLLALATGYPVGVKQFLWFCLILIYPGWLFAVLVSAALYLSVYGTLWVLFWPVRAWMRKNRPDDYAASQQK